jgi:hypothetical protein
MRVETASDDEQEAAIVPAAAAASSAAMADPFAAEGLWNEDMPLKTFEMEYLLLKRQCANRSSVPVRQRR